ncbi:hypothetical protein [Streptomyces sp. NRRL F-5123]|uniref:hypothetical protein n=1 Tax=Streptomyces sp. NRRL F-5123 TaxID=1463856 RepID=UPI0004E113E8|nr:hypothetical protein [Streptomyces sp. NRRL F-5123]
MRRIVTTALLTAVLAAAAPTALAAVPAYASSSAASGAGIWMEDCLVGHGHPVAKNGALTCDGGEFDGQPIDAG